MHSYKVLCSAVAVKIRLRPFWVVSYHLYLNGKNSNDSSQIEWPGITSRTCPSLWPLSWCCSSVHSVANWLWQNKRHTINFPETIASRNLTHLHTKVSPSPTSDTPNPPTDGRTERKLNSLSPANRWLVTMSSVRGEFHYQVYAQR